MSAYFCEVLLRMLVHLFNSATLSILYVVSVFFFNKLSSQTSCDEVSLSTAKEGICSCADSSTMHIMQLISQQIENVKVTLLRLEAVLGLKVMQDGLLSAHMWPKIV